MPGPDRRQRQREDTDRRHRRRRSVLNLVKQTAGCADCGYDAHPSALDFDHRPGTVKRCDPGGMTSYGWPAIWNEIDQCDVVCANCHRVRTAARR